MVREVDVGDVEAEIGSSVRNGAVTVPVALAGRPRVFEKETAINCKSRPKTRNQTRMQLEKEKVEHLRTINGTHYIANRAHSSYLTFPALTSG